MSDEQLKDTLALAVCCAVSSLIVAFIVFPFYIHADLIRNAGMSDVKFMDRGSEILIQACLFGGAVLFLAPSFVLARDAPAKWRRPLIPLFVSIIYPWSPMFLLALGGTNLDGLWYRGILNAFMMLSLPLLNWLLAWGELYLLQKYQPRK